jgi:hypothetical protein
MRVHVDIGGSEALELKGALLVYQGHSRSLVSWHEAPSRDGARCAVPGRSHTCFHGVRPAVE